MSSDVEPPGYELPLRLLLGFRSIIDEAHAELARQGHGQARPLHGFVLQAVGRNGVSATELGRRLGVTKQAAAKHVDALERLGYLERAPDSSDGRSKVIRLTDRGWDMLARSGQIFDEIRARWAGAIGADRLRALDDDLRKVTPDEVFALDVPGWFAG